MSFDGNLFTDLSDAARLRPEDAAIVSVAARDAEGRPSYLELSNRELVERVERVSAALAAQGIGREMRVLFLVMPGLDFVVILHALIRLGAVPVFIDPGHPFPRLVALIKEAEPQALIAIPLAFALKAAQPDMFGSVTVSIVVGGDAADAVKYEDLAQADFPAVAAAPVGIDDTTMIAFTSGSTGMPKGVEFTPRMLRAVVAPLRTERYGFQTGDVDLTMFPITMLVLPTIGMTLVLPELNAAAPGTFDPARFVELVSARKCTTCLGSTPVFWDKMAAYCIERDIQLPSLRVVLLSGAPVPASLLRRLRTVLPNAKCHTPIGSTECGSVASISSDEVLAETGVLTERGAGICVGRPFSDHPVRVIALTPEPIPSWSQARVLPPGEIGEIVVRGPGVSPRYFRRPDATSQARIRDDDGTVWHRTGDVGQQDAQGRLWFCGRASQILEHEGKVYYPVMVESVFNADPSIARCGLVRVAGVGLVLCLELRPDALAGARSKVDADVTARALAMGVPLSRVLVHTTGFPVDARHNAKIDYPALTIWASGELSPRPGEDAARATA